MPYKYLFCFLPLVALSFLSFQSQQQGEYRTEEYYNATCNCLVRATYFPNGKIFSYQEYDSITWTQTGADILFYENGDTASYAYYRKGVQDSIGYNKYKNGRLRYLNRYRKGLLISSKYFSEEGKLLEETEAARTESGKNPSGYTVKYYAANGTCYYSQSFKKGKPSGLKVYDQKLYDEMLYAKANRTGEQLFKDNCTSCHDLLNDATGPPMKGVASRHTEAWLRKWISCPACLIASGDKEAVAIYNTWNKTAMVAFQLPKKDMDKLIEYLKTLK